MHYTGMWAATFTPSQKPLNLAHSVHISFLGIIAVSMISCTILFLTVMTAFLDRMLDAQREVFETTRQDGAYFRALAEAIPGIIWHARPDGFVDFFNKRWYDYTGLSFEQSKDKGWASVIHPDDLPLVVEQWEGSLRTGDTYQLELRLGRSSDGAYRWHLVRAVAVRDATGSIVQWFGICTDIEDQKHNQQILEDQIGDRTVQLADANARLQQEMSERDIARRKLDEQNAKMMFELTERSQRATLLAKMGELLQSCVSKEEVFAAALGFGPKIFPASRGALAVLNDAQNLAEVIGSWTDCELGTALFEPVSCWALRTGHPHLVPAGDSTAQCAHVSEVKTTYLCIPILAQGRALGILHFQKIDSATSISESELSFKTTFAAQIGLSIANIRLREALRTQSIKDPLTGLYNRRYLEEMLEREIRRGARTEQSLGLLMLDLDHFKSFNDTYGHDAGDTVLRETAAFLSRGIRAEDIAYRYGGEEFVIVLPTATLAATQARAERLRAKLRELTVLHQGKSLGMITVSIGVAVFPEHGLLPKELLAAADAALYQAKKEGRDRVVTAEPLTAVNTSEFVVGNTGALNLVLAKLGSS
jgi:diguanylate cyclase (GGDEF)-like protein/PAS domain S-box-containing protein